MIRTGILDKIGLAAVKDGGDSNVVTMAKGWVVLGFSLSLETICEGVETDETSRVENILPLSLNDNGPTRATPPQAPFSEPHHPSKALLQTLFPALPPHLLQYLLMTKPVSYRVPASFVSPATSVSRSFSTLTCSSCDCGDDGGAGSGLACCQGLGRDVASASCAASITGTTPRSIPRPESASSTNFLLNLDYEHKHDSDALPTTGDPHSGYASNNPASAEMDLATEFQATFDAPFGCATTSASASQSEENASLLPPFAIRTPTHARSPSGHGRNILRKPRACVHPHSLRGKTDSAPVAHGEPRGRTTFGLDMLFRGSSTSRRPILSTVWIKSRMGRVS